VIRQGLKHIVEGALVGSGLSRLAAARLNGRAIILAYHNIVPDGVTSFGERALHIPVTEFGWQLDHITRRFDVVSLGRLLRVPSAGGASGRPRVAITFDDAYRGTIAIGLPELVSRGLPGTVFVPPGLLGGRYFWWDLLADRTNGSLEPVVRAHLLEAARGDESLMGDSFSEGSDVGARLPEYLQSAAESEIREAIADTSITLG